MPFLLYVRPLSVFNLIHHNMKLIVEACKFPILGCHLLDGCLLAPV